MEKRKSHLGEVRRGRGRPNKLDFLTDYELKELIDKYSFAGAARKIGEIYGIEVTKQTVRNEARRRGILASKKDIKKGFVFEFFICRLLCVLGIKAVWLGIIVNKGPDVEFKLNGEQFWVECKNWEFNRKIDAKMVEEMILSRFKGIVGRKIVIFSSKPKFTRKARKLLEQNGIEVIWIDDNDEGDSRALNWKNWNSYFRKGLKKLGELFGRFIRITEDVISSVRQRTYDLVEDIVEAEAYEFYERGGGESRVKSSLKLLRNAYGKLTERFKNVCSIIERDIAIFSFNCGDKSKAFVLDESGRLPVNKKLGGDRVKEIGGKELIKIDDRVSELKGVMVELTETIERGINVMDVAKKAEELECAVREVERTRDVQRKELEKIKTMKNAAFYSEAAEQGFNKGKREVRVF